MLPSKNNDIGKFIEQLRQRETTPKERRAILCKIEEFLQNVDRLDSLPLKWMLLLDNVCWPVLTKHDRHEMKTLAGNVLRHIGTLVFDSEFYPEFLIWLGSLYQNANKRGEVTRADIVFSVYFIIGAISQKSKNRISKYDTENVKKSVEWIIKVLPNSSIPVYDQCLKGIVLVTNTFSEVANELFEPINRALLTNLLDFNTHEKNFELLIDTISLFAENFRENPKFAEEMVRIIRPVINKSGLLKVREIKRRLKLTMAVVKMSKNRQMLEETSQMISDLSVELEENNGKWLSASLLTIVCDIFNELLILGKDDEATRRSVEESMCNVLRDLNLSEQNTKEKQAFFNSLAKILQIVKQLPAESQIKTRIHHIVFNKETGLFTSGIRDNRMFSHNVIYKDLINLISVLLTPTSLNHLQAAYTDLRKIMTESMTRLKRSEERPYSDNVRWHESILLLFFSSLKDISTAKSSLIVMMGIRPSIFEFFTGELPLTEYWLPSNHPQVYHIFVTILFKHLQAHDFYIAQSDYLVRGNDSIGQTIGQTKREYARKQVVALQKIMTNFGHRLMPSTRLLISSWFYSLVVAACEQKIGSESFSQREWTRLRNTAHHQSMLDWNNESVRKALATLSAATTWPDFTLDVDRDITDKTKKARWKEATTIWEAGDCKVYIRQSMSTVYKMLQERNQKLILPSSFGAEEFTLVTNFLLKHIVPTTFQKGTYLWMDEVIETIIQGCHSIIEENSDVEMPDTFMEKWDWIINQTASFCIINKMKTPLGKPMQTFQAFENEIKRLASGVLMRKNPNKKVKASEDNAPSSPIKYSIQWLRVHLLLKLIEVLEKLMLTAIHGGSSVFTLTEIPVSARQFFTMNSASCEVWLNRVYYPALVVAYFSGYYALVIRFGSNALTHYARQKGSDEKVVATGVCTACLMSLAMAVLGEPMEIVGLRRRVREEFRTEMGQSLMEGLVEMAHARYEIALVALETILVTDSTLNDTLKLIIQVAMTDMLNRIRLPQAVEYYKKALFGEDPDAPISEDFRSIEMLTKFEKINGIVNEKRQVVDWCARERVQLVESAFSQTMRRNEILDLQKDFSAMGSLAMSVDTSCRLYSDISSTSIVIANLVDRMEGVSSMKNQLTDLQIFDKNDEGNEGDKLAICRKLMHWGRHMKHPRRHSNAAHGEIIRLSRKTSNSQLAFTHINSTIGSAKLNEWQRLEVERQRMKLVKTQSLEVRILEMNEVFGSLADVFNTTVHLKSDFQMKDAVGKTKMISNGYAKEMANQEEHISRASIQLADFFDSLPGYENVLAPNLYPTILWTEIERRSADLSCGNSGMVGALFHLASEMCPSLAKAHLKMAKWAYEKAKIQNAPDIQLFAAYPLGQTQTENDDLWNCLELTCLVNLEKQVRNAITDVVRANMILSPSSHFLRIWETTAAHKRKFLSIAVASYFQFIQNMSGEIDNLPYSKKEETTLATLRILELLVKHGDVLIDVINDGLKTTNVHVWKEILPQLFARLSHPSEHIRKTLVDLISRICTAAPHAVVFQVVSGAASSTEVAEEVEDQQNDDRNRVRACCEQLETKMAQSYPSLVRDVRLFVAELERINLLNEEKWSVVLGTMEHEMEKRLALIRTENTKTELAMHLMPAMKDEIISKKTILLTRQIFDVLDELYQQTIVESPKTKNEEEFVAAFSEILRNAHQESKQTRFISPEKSWAPFKNLIANFVHKNVKKGMQIFETEDISPYLSTLTNSCVPMPGQESVEFDRVVFISRVHKQVTILPTKTRPKKLGFIGSDGKQLAFLFKGREDLHLDERVMQFLRLCNVMLHPGKGKTRQIPDYQAHHYAVIPLGPRSGLIKWVEGATPIFHIYRKWQMKEKLLKQATKKNGETVPEIERPTNMYHNMIREAFSAHKIDATVAADRTKWPTFIVEEVFGVLCAKTPTDLISREIWMRSNDATTWWGVTKRFARSLAVMSMIGSVLGLGDRHLDNLLVDLKWGHVVHIDYNICFDKGKNLRIPETVPFRLTRNMQHALGPSDMYGTFRESCVHVLSTLRSGHQVLTMLLDAFVFDPLVDWTSHDHNSTSGVSLALQLAVYGSNWKSKARERMTDTMELLQLRMTEMHSLWKNNRDDLLLWMKQVTDCLVFEKNIIGANGMYAQQRVKAGTELREAVTRHQALVKELRPLLRSIAKEREDFADYLKFYKRGFIDPLLKGHSALRHEIDIDTCVHNFNIVMQNIDIVFGTLISLASFPVESVTSRASQQQFNPPPGLENVWVVKQDQQENSQAREVVKRVERRLNGWLDGSAPDRKLSPREEVDVLIAEATSPANLAQMYEGWTAWV